MTLSRLFYLFVAFAPFTAFSQSAGKTLIEPPAALFNTWYESPHESSATAIVYRIVKYMPIPGIDKQDEAFKSLTVNADGSIVQGQYCGYCPAVQLIEKKGTYAFEGSNDKFSLVGALNDKEKFTLLVTTLEKDKLVVVK